MAEDSQFIQMMRLSVRYCYEDTVRTSFLICTYVLFLGFTEAA